MDDPRLVRRRRARRGRSRSAARSPPRVRFPARFTRSASEPPSASSIVYQETPPFVSQSKIGTMAGCASCAASCASRRKRCTACSSLRHVRVEHLEGHFAREREVAHAPHGAEGAGAESRDHVVVLAGGPAEARLLGVAGGAHRRRAAADEHARAAPHRAVELAEHRAHRVEAVLRLPRERAREHRRHATSADRGAARRSGGRSSRRILAGERREGGGRELPLVARGGGRPLVGRPLGGDRHPAARRHESVGDLGPRHRPLPAEEIEASGGRDPAALAGDGAVRRAGGVQVGDGGADVAHELERGGEIVGAAALELRPHRFAGDPAAQIAGPARRVRGARPVVVRGGDRRVVHVREPARLGEEPPFVRGVGRAHERERPAEPVHQFLVVAVLPFDAIAPPRPVGRQLPAGEVRRQLVGDAIAEWAVVVRHVVLGGGTEK